MRLTLSYQIYVKTKKKKCIYCENFHNISKVLTVLFGTSYQVIPNAVKWFPSLLVNLINCVGYLHFLVIKNKFVGLVWHIICLNIWYQIIHCVAFIIVNAYDLFQMNTFFCICLKGNFFLCCPDSVCNTVHINGFLVMREQTVCSNRSTFQQIYDFVQSPFAN